VAALPFQLTDLSIDFAAAPTGVPQRGQFPRARVGESGNPQAVHFIALSFQAESIPIVFPLINVTFQRVCGKSSVAEWAIQNSCLTERLIPTTIKQEHLWG
jgi:hypothetical protein